MRIMFDLKSRVMWLVSTASLACVVLFSTSAHGDFVETFESVTGLTPPSTDGDIVGTGGTGWVGALRSGPLGASGIFPGEGDVFPAQAGTSESYVGMNFENAGGSPGNPGDINTWLISPEVTFRNGDIISFYTRTQEFTIFEDRLELRLSTNGSSVNVGSGPSAVGDFTTLLTQVNPNLNGSYPQAWTQFSATVTGLTGAINGRFAFRYTVPDSGIFGIHGDYIGIDTVAYTSAIPEPSSAIALVLGICGIAAGYRRRF